MSNKMTDAIEKEFNGDDQDKAKILYFAALKNPRSVKSVIAKMIGEKTDGEEEDDS